MAFGSVFGSTNNQGWLSAGDAGHIELQVRFAVSVRLSSEEMIGAGALELHSYGCVGNRVTAVIVQPDVQMGTLAEQPVPGVDEVQLKSSRRAGCGNGRSHRRCGSKRGFRGNGQLQSTGADLLHDSAMLLFEAEFQGLLAIFVQGKQVEIVVGSAMENAPVIVDGGIEERVGVTAVFRLDMEGDIPELEIRVVTEDHVAPRIPKESSRVRMNCSSPTAVENDSQHLTGGVSLDIITP